jgi:hypothetical protein
VLLPLLPERITSVLLCCQHMVVFSFTPQLARDDGSSFHRTDHREFGRPVASVNQERASHFPVPRAPFGVNSLRERQPRGSLGRSCFFESTSSRGVWRGMEACL